MLMVSWNSFNGIVGMETLSKVGEDTVCIGDGVEFKDSKGKLHNAVVMLNNNKVVVMYSGVLGDRYEDLDKVEIINIIKSHKDLTLGQFNMVAEHRVIVSEIKGLKEVSYNK